jgi:uncharacterized protein (DUF58 family)
VTQTSLRAWCYTAAAVTAPFVSLAFGAPVVVLALAPVAAAVLVGVILDRPLPPRLQMEVTADETLAGHPVDLLLVVVAAARWAHVDLTLPSYVTIEEVEGGRRVGVAGVIVPLRDGRGEVSVRIRPEQWGAFSVGGGRAWVYGRLGMRVHSAEVGAVATVVALPETPDLRRLVEPFATNMHVGDLVARTRGPGSEPAEVRPWAPGDSPRSINWRASLRGDDTYVTERLADRNGDLVLVVDSVVDPRSEAEPVVAELVRLAATLVEAYGAARHRLGLVSLTGYSRWFGLESGALHVQRLLAALMRTQAVADPVWMVVDRVLERTVRRPTMVVFITSLLEDEMVGRMLRFASVGFDVVAIVWEPGAALAPPPDRRRTLARRIWRLERERTLDRLRSAGVAVGSAGPGASLDATMEEVERWRRHLRRSPV